MQYSRATDVEPTSAALRAIEREWPVIEAEMDLVSVEAALADIDDLSQLDAHRLMAAQKRVETTRARFAAADGFYGWEAA
ncbi:DUF6284 family protein [Cryptosporangium phraense]|uniref:Uncharacterized protein n=1 Tax=Cryptosporangium phraense TaxID=2593070 RepID=A0A545ATF3_9ACTN|nr:DUF6284 family protein [Cryptosporangium phraense]TQS43885.1 hypothetical protein FL583_16965 [Cryptosporangium phraense]